MNREEADRALVGLGAARDRVATAMFAIDCHPALAFLRSGGLDGATAKAWSTAEPLIDTSWGDFTALGDALDRAGEIRARCKPSDAEWAPLQATLTVQIPALVARVEPGSAGLHTWLDEAGRSIDATNAALAPVTDAMARLSARAHELGDTHGIGPLDRRVTLSADAALRDPLSAAPDGTLTPAVQADLAALTADIAVVSKRLDAQAKIRDGYPQRIAALTAGIDELAVVEQQVADAFARAAEKIADPGLPAAPDSVAVLRARVAALDTTRARNDWRKLADETATLEASIGRATQRSRELAEAADGLVERRNELRGRLDAYRAKAARFALDEDATLSPLHSTARELLYTAPCDLAAATRAVFAYQRALTSLTSASSKESQR